MNKFINAVSQETNYAVTENGALARATTQSRVLDFFAQGGAVRNRADAEIIRLFDRALSEDALLATKAMFYFRDVRGGQGERVAFRKFLHHLGTVRPDIVRANLGFIPHFGRWDDLYALVGTEVEAEAFALMKMQFDIDVASEKPASLLGKWLKSENTSSKASRELGRKTRKAFDMEPRAYRKALSSLRRKLAIVERQLSSNEWGAINYEHLPSNAGKVYRKAFIRHDGARYREYIGAVAKGEAKINVKDLFPYEIVREAYKFNPFDGADAVERKALDVSWKNLPNYFENVSDNGIVVADVSGSMYGLPIQIAISLAIYCAERNKGPFQDKFITFSNQPQLQTVEGSDIVQKVNNLNNAHWDMNTNVEAVFNLILATALKHNLSQDDLPGKLYIVSDMEFDACASRGGRIGKTLFENIKDRFERHGYKMPLLVFWNVNARNEQFPMSMDERGFQLVSGASPSVIRFLTTGTALSAYDLMLEVLNSERYANLVV